MKKLLRRLAFPLLFVVFFFYFIYAGFPLYAVKDYLAFEMKKNIEQSTKGKAEAKIVIGDMSTWWFTGVRFDDVLIKVSPKGTKEQPAEFFLDSVKLRLGIFKTLGGAPSFEFDTDLYGANIDGFFAMRGEKDLDSFAINISHLDLSQAENAVRELGLPIAGILDFSANMDFGPKKIASVGGVALDLRDASIGPGKLNLPGEGFSSGLTVPEVKIGHIVGRLAVTDGKADLSQMNIGGGDISLELRADSELKDNIAFSRLDGQGWFQVKKAFLEKNPKFSALFDLNPDIQKYQESDGRVPFHLKGSLAMPRFKFGKR